MKKIFQTSCQRRNPSRYHRGWFTISATNSVDHLLESLNYKPLIVGTDGDISTFQRQSNSLSNYSLFSSIDNKTKSQLISNECSNNKQIDRAVGCMYGMAIGDAVGAPLEFLDATKSIIYPSSMDFFESRKPYFDMQNNLYHNEDNQLGLQRGQYTDDTSMGLCIADSLIVNQKYNGSDIRTRFWNWWFNGYTTANKGYAYGLGGNISQSLYSLKYKDIPDDIYIVTHNNDDSGNGSIMRLAAIPIFFSNSNVNDLLYYAEQSSLTTHPGYRAVESCRLMSYIIMRAIHNDSYVNIKQFLDDVMMEYTNNFIEKELKELSTKTDVQRQIDAKKLILRLIDANESDDSMERNWNWRNKYGDIGIDIAMKNRGRSYNGYANYPHYFGSYCIDGLSMGLHGVYHSESIGAAITNTVNLLGDADSTGSIAGQIAGAFYGFDSSFGEGQFERYLWTGVTKWDDFDIGVRAILLYELAKRINGDSTRSLENSAL